MTGGLLRRTGAEGPVAGGGRRLPALLALAALTLPACAPSPPNSGTPAGRPAVLRPDYAGTVIPPNIAPLNFLVREPGDRFFVEIGAGAGSPIVVLSKTPDIRIPARKWHRLLEANRGGALHFRIKVRSAERGWVAFDPIENRVASEDIDGYLAYRLIKPLYNYWRHVGIYQRNLQSFQERTILSGETLAEACVNCHSFLNNHTQQMSIGLRSGFHGSGTLLIDGNEVTALGAKWGYNSWHPGGGMVAVTLMDVHQFFHAVGTELRDVVDLDSDLVIYHADGRKVDTSGALADPDRLESYPCWSPDGKSLYYCSAAFPFKDRTRVPPENYRQVRYDLRRITYDTARNVWGRPETVVSAEDTGRSALLPRVSPDGRWVAFCLCEYGCFPIFQASSDLHLLDVKTGKVRQLAINSDRSESWHSWSSNGRWLAFSSKRRDGVFTRTYISYIDQRGRAAKPFILPQEDPGFYDTFLKTYTVPELIAEPVRVRPRALAAAAKSQAKVKLEMPETSMTPSETSGRPAASGTDAWIQAPRR